MKIESGHVENKGTIDLIFATTTSVKVTNTGEIDHAHVCATGTGDTETAVYRAGVLNGQATGIKFDYDENVAQNSDPDVYHHVDDTTGVVGDKVTEAGTWSDSTKVETAAQSIINNDIENTSFVGVAICKTGVATTTMTLEAFRDSVNSGTDYTGYTVKVLGDIDLNNVVWEPIGSNAHPFTGIFDGQNYTISNFKVNTPTQSEAGLFGKINGTVNSNFTKYTDAWANDSLVNSAIAEINYTTSIKNLKVSKVTINNDSEDGKYRYSGAVVGVVNNGYLSNIIVSNSNITGQKGIGAVVGAFDGGVANNCTSNSDVNVKAEVYNAGGIAGGTNYATTDICTAFVNCINNATVESAGTNAGGIVGIGQNPTCTIYVGCVNNGTITGKAEKTWDSTNNCWSYGCIAGIVGNGIYSAVLSNCVNNGQIINKGTEGKVAGLMASGCALCYNCTNNADITCSANYLAGIYNYDSSNKHYDNLEVNCVNNGTLANNLATGQTYEINSVTGINVFKNQTYNSIDEVNAAIAANGNATTKFVDCTFNYTIKGTTATLTNNVKTVISDAQFAEFIDYSTASTSYLSVNVPGVTIKNGSSSNVAFNGTLSTSGKNSKIIVAENDSVNSVIINGENVSAVISGTVNNFSFNGSKADAEFTTSAKVGHVSFGIYYMENHTGAYYLKNYGIIDHKQSSTNNGCNEHTVSTIVGCKATIDNYGTIKASKNDGGYSSYAILFYGGCDITLNCYSGSSIVAEGQYFSACGSANSVTMNIYTGATFSRNGATFTPSGSKNVTVNKK